MGRRALVVTTPNAERAAPLFAQLNGAEVEHIAFPVNQEPTIDLVLQGMQAARVASCDLVIGFGGGSVIDTGKAIAILLTNPGEVLDYLEVIGRGQALTRPPMPYIAIPTTAGTGAEVTRNAVLSSPEHRVKVSLRSPLMLPALALVDPELTYGLPPDVTASTGLDALTQLIEPYVTPQSNPLTDALCRDGIQRAARSLRRAYENSGDTAARADMSLAALFGGLALANAKLGAVHGFAGVFGGRYDAPHGAVCAALLPHVMAVNVAALDARQPDSPERRRYDEIARLLTGDPTGTAADGTAWVLALTEALHIPGLASYGLVEADFDELIDQSSRASSMKGNPVQLTPGEMRDILTRAS